MKVKYVIVSMKRPPPRTDSGKVQEVALEDLKTDYPFKTHSGAYIRVMGGHKTQNQSSPQEEGFEMGGEARLDMLVAVDPC